MESAVKCKLKEEELLTLTVEAFGQKPAHMEELADGWANTAYLLELEDGSKTVLKIAPPDGTPMMRYERDMMRIEVDALRRVGNRGDVPVPKVYAYDDSLRLIGSEYYFMAFLQGVPYNKVKEGLSQQERDEIERQLGMFNKRINEERNDRFGPYLRGEEGSVSWSDVFYRMLGDVLADGRDVGVELPVPYEELEAELRADARVLVEVTEPCLVHWDLWDGNVFVDQGSITGIIDFERAFWGDPLMEFFFGRFANSEAFRQGYGRTLETYEERKRRAMYDLYLDLILRIECVYRGYTDENHIRFTKENLQRGIELYRAV